jgi:hypothetical protein
MKTAKINQAYDALIAAKFIVDEIIDINQSVTGLKVYPNNNPANGWFKITCWASAFSAMKNQEDFRIETEDRYEYANIEDLVKAIKKLVK